MTNLDLSYTTKALAPYSIREATMGIAIYNIFSEKYDSNGWASCMISRDSQGNPYAWADDEYVAGYSAQAPCHFMANLSLNF